ncbi:MAG: septum formation initiator family protein [bacterium]|nr:septum formation initiator family protein [bacterium]
MIAKTKTKKSKKDLPQSRINLWFFIVIFLLIGIFLASSGWQMAQRRKELFLRTDALEKEIAVLEKRNLELKAGTDSSSQESFLEKKARENFQLKKPGEKVVIVVVSPSASPEPAAREQSGFWWQKILDKLGL